MGYQHVWECPIDGANSYGLGGYGANIFLRWTENMWRDTRRTLFTIQQPRLPFIGEGSSERALRQQVFVLVLQEYWVSWWFGNVLKYHSMISLCLLNIMQKLALYIDLKWWIYAWGNEENTNMDEYRSHAKKKVCDKPQRVGVARLISCMGPWRVGGVWTCTHPQGRQPW